MAKFTGNEARPIWDTWSRYEYMYSDLAASQKMEKRLMEAYPAGQCTRKHLVTKGLTSFLRQTHRSSDLQQDSHIMALTRSQNEISVSDRLPSCIRRHCQDSNLNLLPSSGHIQSLPGSHREYQMPGSETEEMIGRNPWVGVGWRSQGRNGPSSHHHRAVKLLVTTAEKCRRP